MIFQVFKIYICDIIFIEKEIMPATGTPVEQESNPSAPSSTNSGGASAKQILEVRDLPCFDPKGEPNSFSVRWKRAFNLYVTSKGVTNEGQKVAFLLHSGDTELQEIFITLGCLKIKILHLTIALQSWITILHRKLMFHFSDMFSAKCNRWKGNYRSICVPSAPEGYVLRVSKRG